VLSVTNHIEDRDVDCELINSSLMELIFHAQHALKKRKAILKKICKNSGLWIDMKILYTLLVKLGSKVSIIFHCIYVLVILIVSRSSFPFVVDGIFHEIVLIVKFVCAYYFICRWMMY
jgi:hypothetical protein